MVVGRGTETELTMVQIIAVCSEGRNGELQKQEERVLETTSCAYISMEQRRHGRQGKASLYYAPTELKDILCPPSPPFVYCLISNDSLVSSP